MRKILWTGSAIFLIVLFTAVASAAPAESWGPELGSVIPDRFETLDQDGSEQFFDSLVGEKGLVLVFLRSLDWCRFCKAQAKELESRIDDFAERGLRLVVLSYDSVETLKAFQLKYAPRLTLLSDPQSRVIKAFGILNDREKPNSRGYGIPNPGIIIIDTGGAVRAKFAEKGYRSRPKIDTVLASIDQLNNSMSIEIELNGKSGGRVHR